MVEMSLVEYREQLAIQRETGAELEQERIIKLLEDDLAALIAEKSDIGNLQAEVVEDLIALIKGEN